MLFNILYIGDIMEVEYLNTNDSNAIIDLRESKDYDEYHLYNSINIPRKKLLERPDKYLNKEREVYLICDKGIISKSCSNILNALGYKCTSIIGGIDKIKKDI